jgi:prolyl oligopeptidase
MPQLRTVPSVLTLVCLGLIAVSCSPSRPKPPETRVEIVTDTVHGVPIADSYRWLEDGKSAEVLKWTESQMAYFRSQVDSFPGRETLTKELNDMLNAGGIGELFNIGDLYFSTKRLGGQNQPVLYVRQGLNGPPEVLIDPNKLSTDGTRAMDWHVPSNDGSLVAYGVSSSGTERTTLHIIKTADRTLLADTIPDTRSSSIAWLPDNSGFYYTRNPEPGTVPAGDEAYYRRVYFHKLGSDWKADPLIWEDTADKTAWPNAANSPDGRWLFVTNYHGYFQQQIYFRDERKRDFGLKPLLIDSAYLYDIIPLNDRFFIRTNEGAGRFRVMSATYDHPAREYWKEIIPESKGTINSVLAIGNRLIVNRLENAYSHVTLYAFDGSSPQELALPTLGTA